MVELCFEELLPAIKQGTWKGRKNAKTGFGNYRCNYHMGYDNLTLLLSRTNDSRTPLYLMRVFVDDQLVHTFDGEPVEACYQDIAYKLGHKVPFDCKVLDRTQDSKAKLVERVRAALRNIKNC